MTKYFVTKWNSWDWFLLTNWNYCRAKSHDYDCNDSCVIKGLIYNIYSSLHITEPGCWMALNICSLVKCILCNYIYAKFRMSVIVIWNEINVLKNLQFETFKKSFTTIFMHGKLFFSAIQSHVNLNLGQFHDIYSSISNTAYRGGGQNNFRNPVQIQLLTLL